MIPIQNIYYLLCYAWNKLDEKDHVKVDGDDLTNLVDLFAKILINGTRILLKRGLDSNYKTKVETINGVKGKIDFGTSLKRNQFAQLQATCEFDEFSSDVVTNQILVATMHSILRIETVDKELKKQIRGLILRFPEVSHIALSKNHFESVRLHRNNQFYGFLLDVCKIIFDSILPAENKGEYSFIDFTKDERKMNQLFEHFIFNFYRQHYSKSQVRRDHIKWQFTSTNDIDHKYIPQMKTDITIERNGQKTIIDAKYYKETLSSFYDTEKVKSVNLYQIFSYLLNQRDGTEGSSKTKGILLYPTIDKEYNLVYQYDKHPIQIRTVDLNQHWTLIEERLMKILS
ncbi:5-methylcytosine-specific restriction enzyme subunit McrC [Ekhidna lutea]|uniref:5-methylcytosine-specific restriction enzyme subunit McrC n=1 Tax=Ekhidna lutea TaxID=447679 RepID=A0A239LDW3_EKHLU|nr:5-methylcytosine-specific restriction endonuclease system specificity protein McrC [Ekhidna lutea]SNT28671.1 5-methylcytosine-specific restriction enzyme subunit McrC [Ekhidna lutea]